MHVGVGQAVHGVLVVWGQCWVVVILPRCRRRVAPRRRTSPLGGAGPQAISSDPGRRRGCTTQRWRAPSRWWARSREQLRAPLQGAAIGRPGLGRATGHREGIDDVRIKSNATDRDGWPPGANRGRHWPPGSIAAVRVRKTWSKVVLLAPQSEPACFALHNCRQY